jgi:hypothetical protein
MPAPDKQPSLTVQWGKTRKLVIPSSIILAILGAAWQANSISTRLAVVESTVSTVKEDVGAIKGVLMRDPYTRTTASNLRRE